MKGLNNNTIYIPSWICNNLTREQREELKINAIRLHQVCDKLDMPANPFESNILKVSEGQKEPETDFEKLWVRYISMKTMHDRHERSKFERNKKRKEEARLRNIQKFTPEHIAADAIRLGKPTIKSIENRPYDLD